MRKGEGVAAEHRQFHVSALRMGYAVRLRRGEAMKEERLGGTQKIAARPMLYIRIKSTTEVRDDGQFAAV